MSAHSTDTGINMPIRNVNNKGRSNVSKYIHWGLIILFLISTVMGQSGLSFIPNQIKSFMMFPMIVLVCFHGIQRYGFKNMGIWFVITWFVSNGFEALSIKTGFPFGYYYYNTMPGPRFLDVPFIIMVMYFGLGYISWTVAQIVTRNFGRKIVGIYKFILPMTTAMIMTMFDLTGDPLAATISNQWVWKNGGAYYGVPISNYFGWVFVVYLLMQIFTLFILNKNMDVSKEAVTAKRSYWLEGAIVYLILGFGVVLAGFTHTDHAEIYTSMAMISVFTMVFTAMIAILNVKDFKESTS